MLTQLDQASAQITTSGDRYLGIARLAANASNKTGQVSDSFLRSLKGSEKWERADNSILKDDPQSAITNQNGTKVCTTGGGKGNGKTCN